MTAHPNRRANGNGNGHKNGQANPWAKIGAESLNLGVAEVISGTVSLGTWGLLPEVFPAGVDTASKMLSNAVVKSHLHTLQKILGTVCHLKECQPDPNTSEDQQAYEFSRAAVLFAASFGTSFAAKLLTRKVLNHAMGLTPPPKVKTGNWFKDHLKPNNHDFGVVLWDEGIHIGALLAGNTVFAKQSDDAIEAMTGWMQKTFGWSEHKAKEMASLFVIWEVPNLMGWMGGVGKIARDQLKTGSHAEALAVKARDALTQQPSHS